MNRAAWPCRNSGQGTVEFALAVSVALLIVVATVQLGVLLHARTVLIGAVQDGARVAAARGGTAESGMARTRQLMIAGLVSLAASATISGGDDGDTVTIAAQVPYRLVAPPLTGRTILLSAQTTISKETFRGQP